MSSGDWRSELSPEEREGWEEFVEAFRRDAVGKIAGSAAFLSLVPKREHLDVKFAAELGTAIMLDKPILAIVLPGAEVTGKLRQVADVVIEADIDTEEGRATLEEALAAFLGRE